MVFVLCALLAGQAAASPAEYVDNHPRLFFAADETDALMAAILADTRRAEVWAAAQSEAALAAGWPAEHLLSSYFGYNYIEELSLLSSLETGPEAAVHARAVIDALLWQIDTYDTEPDAFLSVLGVALRLHNLAWGWDLAAWAADEAEREAIATEMLLYLEALSTDWEFTRYQFNPYVSNKGITLGAMLLLGVLALEPDLPDAPEIALARQAAALYLSKGLGDLLTPGGYYREGLGYFVWTLRTLLPTWRAQERGAGERPWSDAQLQAILEATAYQMMDEGEGLYLNRNDHNSRDFIVGRHHSVFEFASRFGEDPDFARWLLRRSSGDLGHPLGHYNDPMATLLWHASGPERGPQNLSASRLFPEGGFWVYRTSWPGDAAADRFLLTLEGGEFKGGHAQEDVGQLIFRAMGHGFALDHGAGFTAKETEAHNLPLVGGRGQHNAGSSIGTDGELRRLIAGPHWEALRVDMTAAYTTHSPFNDPDYPVPGSDWSWGYDGGNPMDRAWRELLLLPGEAGELPEVWLRDRLRAASLGGGDIEWRLHMDADLLLDNPEPGLHLAAGAGGRLRMQLHSPDPALTSAGSTLFDNENLDPDSRVLSVSYAESAADLLWQWTPLRPGEADPLTFTDRNAEGLRARSQRTGRERSLFLAHGDEPFAIEGDSLRGAWGLVERGAGPTRTLLVDGTRLVEGGLLRIALAGPGSAGCEGDTVRLSPLGRAFRIWAPQATAVVAEGEAVFFVREAEYVVGPAEAPPEPPSGFALLQPWPNPGLPPLRFGFDMPAAGAVVLSIYDVRGRRLRSLRRELAEGQPEIVWDGRDAAGKALPGGLYIARAEAGGRSASRKFVLLGP